MEYALFSFLLSGHAFFFRQINNGNDFLHRATSLFGVVRPSRLNSEIAIIMGGQNRFITLAKTKK